MKKFEECSIKTQKKRIVQDAIAQIQNKTFRVSNGNYMIINNEYHHNKNNQPKGKISIKDILLKQEKNTCTVCAKGAIFAACVLNVNKVYLKDHYSEEEFQKGKLKKWFSPLELDMIETAFERTIIVDTDECLEEGNEYYYNQGDEENPIFEEEKVLSMLGRKCIKFGKKYKSDKNRLLAILNNILINGEFKP